MAAYESRLQRLEDRVHVPGSRSHADDVRLQELIVTACYGVRAAVMEMEANGTALRWPPQEFERFATSVEAELVVMQRQLRGLTKDHDAAWAARLARLEAHSAGRGRHRA